jgi:hypothetical protein
MKKRCKRFALWLMEHLGFYVSLFIIYPIVMLGVIMSNRNRIRKQRQKKYSGKTTKTITKNKRKEPVLVMPNKHSSDSQDKPSIDNVFPGRKYKVISKPAKWTGSCRFEGQIGQCMGTDRVHGAKLKFVSNEIIAIPFENIELHEAYRYKAPSNKLPVVAIEPEKGKYYKVIKKPARWNTPCKYVGQIGLCILIDDRGTRLRFSNSDDISFESECLTEAAAVNLNESATEITEDNVQIGDTYRVIKKVDKFGTDAEDLIGKVGKAKWANYRGVCIKFPNTSGYVIPFNCLEKYYVQEPPNPVKVPQTLNANNVVIHRKYKIARLNQDYTGDPSILGKLGTMIWASDISKGAMIKFDTGYEKFVPFSCLEDLPRPSEDELVALIKQHPERILRIIKGLSKITKLKPVIDFVQGGQLPNVEAEIPPDKVYGPHIPACHSEALTMPCAGSVGDVVDAMLNRVVNMINSDNAPLPNNVAIEEVPAAED